MKMILRVLYGVAVVMAILLAVAVFQSMRKNSANEAAMIDEVWLGTDIRCLQSGHEELEEKAAVRLTITVNGEPEEVPMGIGKLPKCLAELHATDEPGVIHAESEESDRTFTLEQFMNMMERSVERPGMELIARVNDVVVEDPKAVVLEDGQVISLSYTFDPNAPMMVPSEDESMLVPLYPE